jgi:hypothetical protein
MEQCATCRFWLASLTDAIGQCRRHAPVPEGHSTTRWPLTKAGDGCGEHAPQEPSDIQGRL